MCTLSLFAKNCSITDVGYPLSTNNSGYMIAYAFEDENGTAILVRLVFAVFRPLLIISVVSPFVTEVREQ